MNFVIRNMLCYFNCHKLIEFKHCSSHLIAAYCSNCSTIKVGNPLFYTKNKYQDTYKGQEALDFLDNDIKYLKIEQKKNIYDVLKYYESIEKLEKIKHIIIDNMNHNQMFEEISKRVRDEKIMERHYGVNLISPSEPIFDDSQEMDVRELIYDGLNISDIMSEIRQW